MKAPMGKQGARQAARREALESQAKLRARQVAKERRLSRLGLRVSGAVRERDAAVAKYDQRAAAALIEMVDQEGVTWKEAAAWCGVGVSAGDVIKLRRLAKASRAPSSSDPSSSR